METRLPKTELTMYFVALCRKYLPETGDYLRVTTHKNCLPASVLSVPGLHRITATTPILAAEKYIEMHSLLDKFSPPLEVQFDDVDELLAVDKDGNWTDCPDGQPCVRDSNV